MLHSEEKLTCSGLTVKLRNSTRERDYKLFIVPFNNTRNLKFNSPITVAFFTAVNQGSGSLRKQIK